MRKRTTVRVNSKPRRTVAQYQALSERSIKTLARVRAALDGMRRDKKSLTKAARDAKTTPKTLLRAAPEAFKKGSGGRYSAKRNDRLLRPLRMIGPDGPREIIVRGFRRASELGKYSSAVDRYIATGDASALAKFKGKFIKDADGKKIPFITDLAELKRLGKFGLLSFESLYSRTQ